MCQINVIDSHWNVFNLQYKFVPKGGYPYPDGGLTAHIHAILILCIIWKTAEPHTTKMNNANSHGPTCNAEKRIWDIFCQILNKQIWDISAHRILLWIFFVRFGNIPSICNIFHGFFICDFHSLLSRGRHYWLLKSIYICKFIKS